MLSHMRYQQMRNSTSKFKAQYSQSLIRSYSLKAQSPCTTQSDSYLTSHLQKATSTVLLPSKMTPLPAPKKGQPKVEGKIKGIRQSQIGSRLQNSQKNMQREEQTLLNRKIWGGWQPLQSYTTRETFQKSSFCKEKMEKHPIRGDPIVTRASGRVSTKTSQGRQDPQQFLDALKPNSLFYCCACYQYVFEIEKKRHYPDCKDRLLPNQTTPEQYTAKAWSRLDRLLQLARYVRREETEIAALYKEAVEGEFHYLDTIVVERDSLFMNLDQIVQAFVFTYQHLIRGKSRPRRNKFFACS